jgi:cytochrome P450
VNTIPGIGWLEKRLLTVDWKQHPLAEPPPGSGLKPVMGDRGLAVFGDIIGSMREGPDFALHVYQMHGPVFYFGARALPLVVANGPDVTEAIFSNRNKDYSQKGWYPLIGPFFKRGLLMLDFDEHMYHRRIMQEAFTRSRLSGYVGPIDQVARSVVADWPTDDARFLFHPAMKELTLDIASVAFMGHEPGTDVDLVTKVNKAFTTTTRAGGAIIRTGVPPFKWWQGLQARKVLEDYFNERIADRRSVTGNDMLSVLCHAEDEDGNSFTDEDVVNQMILLMMAAHDTSTSATTTMAYHLAAYPEWQERCRDESAQLGDGPLDIESLEKLGALDLVMDESLRLVTPLPFNMRHTVRDTELLGYYLPAGTNVMTWPGMNHRLPELWTDPLKFDPERFVEPRAEHKKHRYAFAPFGGGVHKCIGMGFARLEVKAVMHQLLTRYRLELPRPDYQPRWDHAGMPVPMDGMPIVLRRL